MKLSTGQGSATRQSHAWGMPSRRLAVRSLAPRNDGHFAGFEPGEDWRAFRAHLVDLERKGLDWEPSHNPDSPHLLWYQETALSRPPTTPQQHEQARRPSHPSIPTSKDLLTQNSQGDASEIGWSSKQVWAHTLVRPEVGCVLLARPDSDATQGFFHRAVVLITAHDDAHGTTGLVLNKPTPITLQELTTVAQQVQGFRSVFGHQRVHLGGPVGLDHITLLHRYRGVRGSTPVAEGLYTGGLPDAVQLAQAGLANTSNFLLALGMSGWAPHQLQQELDTGCWHVVAAGTDLLLPQSSTRTASTGSDQPKGPGALPAWLTTWSGARLPGVPPLRPPPQHPQKASSGQCLWTRLMAAAQLI